MLFGNRPSETSFGQVSSMRSVTASTMSFGAEIAGDRGEHDQEREQRHQHGQRDVTCDRPAVVAVEAVIGGDWRLGTRNGCRRTADLLRMFQPLRPDATSVSQSRIANTQECSGS